MAHALMCLVLHLLLLPVPCLPAGGKHFSLVVTAHWQGDAQHVQHYAFKSVDNNGVQFLRPDNALINRWKKGLQVRSTAIALCTSLPGGVESVPCAAAAAVL